MDPTSLLTVIAVVGGFLIAAAGGIATWAALRTSRQAATLADLTAAADAATRLATVRKAEIEEQDEKIADLEKALTAKDIKIAALEGRVTQLSELVTGRPAWDQLTGALGIAATATQAKLAEVLAQEDQIRTEIRAVRELVTANAELIERNDHGRGPPRNRSRPAAD